VIVKVIKKHITWPSLKSYMNKCLSALKRMSKKLQAFWSSISSALTVLATLVTIFGIGFWAIVSPLQDSIEPLRISKYKKIIEDIKIGSSEEYVESVLGIPKRENLIDLNSETDDQLYVIRNDYINKDFLYSVYFTEKNGLVGMGLITLNKHFKPRIPTRDYKELLEFNQAELVPYTPFFIESNFSGSRSDNSNYFLEFIGPTLDTDNLYIGYGISELGFIKKSEREYFYNYLFDLRDFRVKIPGNENNKTTPDIIFLKVIL